MQSALEEENLFRLLITQFFFLATIVLILFTPNFFLFIQNLGSIVPFNSIIVLCLMPLYALNEANVVNVEAIANTITSLTILLLLCIYGVSDHFSIF